MNKTNNSQRLLRLTVLSFLVALGVVISPVLRFEGMCPMAHFINIVCSVLLGPWYSLLCAVLIGIIRMSFLGIPPIALTGAVFGAFLSGVLYKASRGKIIFAFLGEVMGTGIIGALASYPVMTFIWGKEGLGWMFYIPSFICGTLIGGSIAVAFLRRLLNSGILSQLQEKLGTFAPSGRSTLLEDSVSIGALGVICFIVIRVLSGIFDLDSVFFEVFSVVVLICFGLWGAIYYFYKKRRAKN